MLNLCQKHTLTTELTACDSKGLVGCQAPAQDDSTGRLTISLCYLYNLLSTQFAFKGYINPQMIQASLHYGLENYSAQFNLEPFGA